MQGANWCYSYDKLVFILLKIDVYAAYNGRQATAFRGVEQQCSRAESNGSQRGRASTLRSVEQRCSKILSNDALSCWAMALMGIEQRSLLFI